MNYFVLTLLFTGMVVASTFAHDYERSEPTSLCDSIRLGDHGRFHQYLYGSSLNECSRRQNPSSLERGASTLLGFLVLPLAPLFWYEAAHEEPESPLAMAVWYKRFEMARELIDNGADVNHQDGSGYTALHWASSSMFDEDTYEEMARMLLNHGARRSLGLQDSHGKTPLHWAASHGHVRIARLLIDSGACVNALDNEGKTPLHHAYHLSSDTMVDLLIGFGALTHIRDHDGKLPHECAYHSPENDHKISDHAHFYHH